MEPEEEEEDGASNSQVDLLLEETLINTGNGDDDFIDIMNNIHTVEPSKSLNVTLRPYQQDALSWMTDREVIKSPTYEMQNPSFNQHKSQSKTQELLNVHQSYYLLCR